MFFLVRQGLRYIRQITIRNHQDLILLSSQAICTGQISLLILILTTNRITYLTRIIWYRLLSLNILQLKMVQDLWILSTKVNSCLGKLNLWTSFYRPTMWYSNLVTSTPELSIKETSKEKQVNWHLTQQTTKPQTSSKDSTCQKQPVTKMNFIRNLL